MKNAKVVSILLVATMMVGIVGTVLADDLSPAERKRLESELRSLQSKLTAARASSVTVLENKIGDIENALGGPEDEAAGMEVSLSLDVASAYVFRGVTFNDGAVLQPGLEVAGLPITLGVWGNIDVGDYDGALEKGQFSELDIYCSYDLPIDAEPASLSVGYCEYTYPSGGGDADRELSLCASFDKSFSPEVGVYYGINGGIEGAFVAEASASHEIAVDENVTCELGALVSFVSVDSTSGLDRFELSASFGFDIFSIGLLYVGQIDEDVLPDGPYDVSFLGTVGVAQSF